MGIGPGTLESLVALIVSGLDRHLVVAADQVITDLGRLSTRFEGRTILITGAAGFLGAHLLHYFTVLNRSLSKASQCRVLAVDNFIRGVPDWLAPLGQAPGVEVVRADVSTLPDGERPDFVIHGASIASPTYYRLHPIETMDANVMGLRRLLEYAVRRMPEGFLFFSSSEIYGDPDPASIPTPETYRGFVSCTGPRACYDESKRFGETLCVNFAGVHGLPITIARPFNNYGPGLRISDRRVLPDFFRDVLGGRDITLLSDGRASRTFCYVSDATSGYLRILLLGRRGEAYNIGADAPEIAMKDLAELVLKTAKSTRKVVYQRSEDADYVTDNPVRRCPDIRKAREQLGYSPKIGLEEGLRLSFEYYEDHPNE